MYVLQCGAYDVDIQYCVADIIIEKLELHHFVYCILNLGKNIFIFGAD